MSDHYLVYKKSFLSEQTVRNKKNVHPLQILSFFYTGKPDINLVLTFKDFPINKNLHCIKLNEVPTIELYKATLGMIDKRKKDEYESAREDGILIPVLAKSNYMLPLITPAGPDFRSYYQKYLKNSPLTTRFNAYRTYEIEKMNRVTVVVPNLVSLGYLSAELNINWKEPDFNSEWDSIKEQIDNIDWMRTLMPDRETYNERMATGQVVTLNRPDNQSIRNHTPNADAWKQIGFERREKMKGMFKLNKGTEMPIVLNVAGHFKWLLTGNTRLAYVMEVRNLPAKVWMVNL